MVIDVDGGAARVIVNDIMLHLKNELFLTQHEFLSICRKRMRGG